MSINIDKTKDASDLDLSEVVQLFDEKYVYVYMAIHIYCKKHYCFNIYMQDFCNICLIYFS